MVSARKEEIWPAGLKPRKLASEPETLIMTKIVLENLLLVAFCPQGTRATYNRIFHMSKEMLRASVNRLSGQHSGSIQNRKCSLTPGISLM